MVSIIAAFQFLTIFPTLIKRMFTSQEMGRAVAYFPLVGIVLGLCLYAVNFFAQKIFASDVSSAITIFAWVIFTRAFHLDGFMDTCDALFGGWTPERRLEIMKDSRMGAFGVAGGILVLLMKYTALHSSFNLFPALILATTLGRWASPLIIYSFPYARDEGMVIEMKKNVRIQEAIIATLIAGTLSFYIYSWIGLLLMLISAVIAVCIALYAMRLLNGLTGDIYGTVTTSVEMFILIVFTIKDFGSL